MFNVNRPLKYLDQLRQAILNPSVEQEKLDETLAEIKSRLPIPVFWLLGKTQSGKTSLVRALTGQDEAEIGDGFRACTTTARLYDFPTPEECLIHFLDTRGLGETDYDPSEDIELFTEQSHVLIVVIKAMDHSLAPVLEAVETIRRRRPEWPILVAQTCLHEGYPGYDMEHIEPYPYAREPLPLEVPRELAISLQRQRQYFAHLKHVSFVAVDFTREEDGFANPNYGLEALWDELEKVFPWGLRELLPQGNDIYAARAHPHIIAYSLLAGGVEALPVPMLPLPLMMATQAKMFHTLAAIYHQPISARGISEITAALGTGYLLRLGGRELAKLVPGYGQAVAAAYSAAVTYALGQMLCQYFARARQGQALDEAELRQLFERELSKGRQALEKYFRRQ